MLWKLPDDYGRSGPARLDDLGCLEATLDLESSRCDGRIQMLLWMTTVIREVSRGPGSVGSEHVDDRCDGMIQTLLWMTTVIREVSHGPGSVGSDHVDDICLVWKLLMI